MDPQIPLSLNDLDLIPYGSFIFLIYKIFVLFYLKTCLYLTWRKVEWETYGPFPTESMDSVKAMITWLLGESVSLEELRRCRYLNCEGSNCLITKYVGEAFPPAAATSIPSARTEMSDRFPQDCREPHAERLPSTCHKNCYAAWARQSNMLSSHMTMYYTCIQRFFLMNEVLKK